MENKPIHFQGRDLRVQENSNSEPLPTSFEIWRRSLIVNKFCETEFRVTKVLIGLKVHLKRMELICNGKSRLQEIFFYH